TGLYWPVTWLRPTLKLVFRVKFVFSVRFILDGSAAILTQPGRWQILQFLRRKGPSYVEEIAKETGIHPRLVSHHLDVLQERNLIESKYEVASIEGSKRGVAVRTCRATKKAEEVLEDLRKSAK